MTADEKAMTTESRNHLIAFLFDPFRRVAGGRALGLGLAVILATGAIGYFSHGHVDGVLDLHEGGGGPLWRFFAEGMIDWLSLAAVLMALGRMFSATRFRTVDLFGTQALARWPVALSVFAMLVPGFHRVYARILDSLRHQAPSPAQMSGDLAVFFAVMTVIYLVLIWTVVLMYRSYTVSCNLRGARAVATFICGMIAAEILSKVLLHALLVRYGAA